MKSIVLAVEDSLSESIGRQIARSAGWDVTGQPKINNGKSQLEKNFEKYCQRARREAVLLIVDMDRSSVRHPCPSVLIDEWAKGHGIPPKMFFRVAVHEIESWLMADHEAMQILIGHNVKLPPNPDALVDPKMVLLNMLKQVKRHLRDGVVRVHGSNVSQGVAYNAVLGKLVDEHWSPERAAQKSESLSRAFSRLREFTV
jgi:hypothetical protein